MSKPEGFKIKINNNSYTHLNQFITGLEVKTTDSRPLTDVVYLKVPGPGQDKKITDNEQVDLSQPGTEHFFTTPTTMTEG